MFLPAHKKSVAALPLPPPPPPPPSPPPPATAICNNNYEQDQNTIKVRLTCSKAVFRMREALLHGVLACCAVRRFLGSFFKSLRMNSFALLLTLFHGSSSNVTLLKKPQTHQPTPPRHPDTKHHSTTATFPAKATPQQKRTKGERKRTPFKLGRQQILCHASPTLGGGARRPNTPGKYWCDTQRIQRIQQDEKQQLSRTLRQHGARTHRLTTIKAFITGHDRTRGSGQKVLQTPDASYHRGAPCFFGGFPQLGSLRPLSKTDLEKHKTATG